MCSTAPAAERPPPSTPLSFPPTAGASAAPGRRALLRGGAALLSAPVAAAFLAGCAAAPPRPDTPDGWQVDAAEPAGATLLPAAGAADPLAPFHRDLAALQRGAAARPVRVIVFGDSHTAGPWFVARLRELLQERFGALGPGALPPGRAPRFYRPALVEVTQEGEWAAFSALRDTTPGPFGLTGYRLEGSGRGSRIALRTTEAEPLNEFAVTLLQRPDGGSCRVTLDGRPLPLLSGKGPAGAAPEYGRAVPGGFREAVLELSGDGPVSLLGWRAERRGRGVIVEGHGIIGATVEMLDHMDQAILRGELGRHPPALVVLAYGTNEAAAPDLTEDGYAAALAARVRSLRAMAPRAAILLAGAPDSARRGAGTRCGWVKLQHLDAVRAAQRRVAAGERLGYWDWAGVTGGSACALDALTRADPPLAAADHVHFTEAGYRLAAEQLFGALLRGLPPANNTLRRA